MRTSRLRTSILSCTRSSKLVTPSSSASDFGSVYNGYGYGCRKDCAFRTSRCSTGSKILEADSNGSARRNRPANCYEVGSHHSRSGVSRNISLRPACLPTPGGQAAGHKHRPPAHPAAGLSRSNHYRGSRRRLGSHQRNAFMLDLIGKLGAPAIVASRTALGTINHTLLTLSAIRQARLTVHGVVMIGTENVENRLAIERYGDVPVIGWIPWLDKIDRDILQSVFENRFDKNAFV